MQFFITLEQVLEETINGVSMMQSENNKLFLKPLPVPQKKCGQHIPQVAQEKQNCTAEHS
jgi:hypothetical protein